MADDVERDPQAGPGAGSETGRPARPLPARATMGLLDLVTMTSLDEDYAHVSEKRRQEATDGAAADTGAGARLRRVHPLALVTLALVGALMAMAGLETARNATTTARSKDTLVSQVQDRRAELTATRTELTELRSEVESLQNDYLDTTAEGRQLRTLLADLGAATGASAVQGPGVRIVVDDAPGAVSAQEQVLDTDLQRLVNGLWASGAEAIAINGHRLTNLVAIRMAGDAITVGKSLTRPYVVDAIGDPEQLPARFIDSDGGTWWLNLQSVYQMRFRMTSEDNITVPAAPNLRLRLADQPGTGR